MKKSLLFFVGMLLSILVYGQVPTPNLVKSYLFTGGSLQNTINPGTKDLIKTGTASTLVPSNYLVADDAISLNGDFLDGSTSSGNTNFSLSFWMKTSTNDASNRFIFSQFNAIQGFGVKCSLLNGRVVFGGSYKQSSNASAFNSVTSLNSLADGRWHHVVATAVKITQSVVIGQPAPNYFRYSLYVDDVLQGTADNAASIYIISLLDNTTPFIVGNDNSLVADQYEDAIDDIRYYERAISTVDIHNLYYDNIPEGIVYVDQSAIGNNDGTSWADAYTNLQTALTSYVSKKTIWVATGRYTPHASDRKASFMLPNALKIYGGFNGTETDLSQRNVQANNTIMSGDLAGNDNANIVVTESTRQDNSFHVVTMKGNVKDIVVDGFTIADGNAGGTNDVSCSTAAASQYNDQRGAAIYAFPYVTGQAITAMFRNCILEHNTGYNIGVTSSFVPCGVTGLSTDLDFESCIVRNNRTRDLSAFLFSGNSSYQIYAKGSIVNSLFHNNISDNGTSAVYLAASSSNGGTALGIDVQILNTTFAGNSGLSGNVINMVSAANTTIRNSIVYGNGGTTPFVITTSGSTVQSSIVQGGQLGGMNADPMFKNTAEDDYTLSCGSPAINSGNDAIISLPHDLAGGNRKEGTVDMGAYEFVSLQAITAISKNITIQLDANGNASITPADIDNGSGAVCGVAFTLSVDKSEFTCADLGDNTVTLTATENTGGAFSSTNATVTVTDETQPVILTQNLTVQLDENGDASILPTDIDNGSSDNCTPVEELMFSLNKTDFTTADLGVNYVTLTITDGSANQTSATATVTVEDNLPPIAVAQNIVLALDANGSVALSPAQINNGSSDNSTANENLQMTLDRTTFTCSERGENTVVLTVQDQSGNQASTTATVTIVDNLTPVVNTQDIAVVLDINGNALISAESINNNSSDNCTAAGQLTFSLDKTIFTSTDLGANMVTLTVEDVDGNEGSATAIVNVSKKLHQTIIIEALPDVTYGSANIALSAFANSALPVNFTVVSGPATLGENQLVITGTGTVTISASQDGNVEYYPAPVVQESFDVLPAPLTITADDQTTTYGNAIPTLTFQYTGFVLDENQSALSSEPMITTEGTANSNAGTYEIILSGGSAANYTFVFIPGTLTIGKADQVVSIEEITTKATTDQPFNIVASTTSGLPLTYEISGPASLDGHTITLSGTHGQVVVTAMQDGDHNFNDASASISFNVKEEQTITFVPIEDQIFEDGQTTMNATSSSGLEVAFELASGPATINENVISFNGTGTVVVRATQAGNEEYFAADAVEQSFEIVLITGVENNTFGVRIYPNPADDFLHIEIEKSAHNTIGVFSVDGKQMMSIQNAGTVNVSDLKSGLYLIRINASGKTMTYKLFKK
ncbi:MAG TPA: MBG domain-containing protein [Chryseosolibacter sp.]|nr:MBG domain-containing protein [Chryseosolibacter sp.]